MAKEVILRKVKHLLGVPEEEFGFLDRLKKDDLNALYLQMAKVMNEGQTGLWQKLATVNHYVPAFLAAKMAENIFGEVICANVSSYMNVKEALKVMNHLSIDFMSRVTPHMIPEKTRELVNAIPLKTVRKITRKLIEKEDYFSIGRFVDTLELSNVITIAKEDVNDDLILLKISTYVENKSVVARIFASFSDDQKVHQIITAYKHDLIGEVMTTLLHLTQAELIHLKTLTSRLPESLRKQIDEYLDHSSQ